MDNKTFEVVAELKSGCYQKINFMRDLIGKDYRLAKYEVEIKDFKERLSQNDDSLTIVEQLVRFRSINHEMIDVEGRIVNDYLSFGHYDQLISKDVYIFVCKVMRKLIFSDTWRGKKGIEQFKIIEKEALNAKIWFLLLIRRQEVENKPFDSNVIVGYLIKRMIRKGSFWDSKPENKAKLMNKVPEFESLITDDAMESASKIVGNLFIAEINYLASKITKEEKDLFRQARAIATAIEFEEVSGYMFPEDVVSSDQLIKKDLEAYDLEGLYKNDQLMNLFRRISRSRYTNRWEMYIAPLGCNLLAHHETTAVFSWLMAIEESKFEKAGEFFVISLFHDDPEIWTDDVPSPCKDRNVTNTGITLREVCDTLEVAAFDEHFYPYLPDGVGRYYSEHVDLNGVPEEEHKLVKKADYLSADFEVLLNIAKGSCHKELADVILKDLERPARTPESHKLLEYFAAQMKQRFIDI